MMKLGLDFCYPFDTDCFVFPYKIGRLSFLSFSSFSSKCLPSVALLPLTPVSQVCPVMLFLGPTFSLLWLALI